MARTSVPAVETVLDTSLTDDQVQAFIDDASLWVDENLADDGLSTARLTAIEKYLACYYATVRDPRLTRRKFDDVDETLQRDGKVSEYLKLAASFDPTGKIDAEFGTTEKKQVRHRWAETFSEEAGTVTP